MSITTKVAFWLAYVYGGAACVLAVFIATLLTLIPLPKQFKERAARRMIHWLSAGLVHYLEFVGLLKIEFQGISGLSEQKGVIIALNHPTYLDAILILSRLPHVFCLTKSSILSNPLVAATARCAGYESNSNPARLMDRCCERLLRGESLLVFPEGTRTVLPPVGPLKRGFAILAVRMSAPVFTVLVKSCNGSFLRQGQPFFRLPQADILHYHFSLSRTFLPQPEENSKDFRRRIEEHFHAALGGVVP
jgi:1-acyl-sn-glycerol-3-phosphate acyltransferase